MNNLNVHVDKKLCSEINNVRKPLGLNFSQVVTEALRNWLKRNKAETFEQEWIEALKKNPDDAKRAEDWLDAQAW